MQILLRAVVLTSGAIAFLFFRRFLVGENQKVKMAFCSWSLFVVEVPRGSQSLGVSFPVDPSPIVFLCGYRQQDVDFPGERM